MGHLGGGADWGVLHRGSLSPGEDRRGEGSERGVRAVKRSRCRHWGLRGDRGRGDAHGEAGGRTACGAKELTFLPQWLVQSPE